MKKIFTLLLFCFNISTFAQVEIKVQPFLPELFSQYPSVRDLTISPNEDEAYFSAQSILGEVSVIVRIKKENRKWTKPEIAPFSGKFNDLEPFLSHDGLRLYFASDRPIGDLSDKKDYDIWYVERTLNGPWSNPINMGDVINTKQNEFYPSVAKNGNIYFTTERKDTKGKDDIYFSQWKDDHYTNPISLSESINTNAYEFNAYVSSDESYIIFTGYRWKDGLGSGDLYISYNKNGIWTKAKNLGRKINSDQMDYCPFVNAKTKTMYFTSRRSVLNKTTFNSHNELLYEITRYSNGSSRIYKVTLTNKID
ncbi:MAG: hypothetical protein COW08_06230 [Ignavibacteriales bacterium CG12_big_fil_rev_8_21_14_0_65_30_8]|nr:MAG: hypothetical protein COW08_06230 [Ignavibacteriales bacterium CG12_big_fil_rev_8_21_14_0_65_30_8]